MPNILVLQHAAPETLGTIADALTAAGVAFHYVRTFEGEPVPDLGDAAGLVVMGGPQSVYEQDTYPYLRDELRLIEQALSAGRPILGVCLGSQLLAAALGAPVTVGRQKEIGWHQVKLTAAARSDPLLKGIESPLTAFHWHGDVFALPQGTVSLALSALTEHQAFRYGPSAYGFLFHLEVTAAHISGMVRAFPDELAAARVDGPQLIAQAQEYLPALQTAGAAVFGRWASLVATGSAGRSQAVPGRTRQQ